MRNPHKRTLVIGLGNPLSGDDGFGFRVLELLRKTVFSPDVDFQDAHTDLLGRMETFADYDRVLLIDAILDSGNKLGQTGRVLPLEEDAFLSWPESSHGIHQMSPLLAVKLFRTLNPSARVRIFLVGLFVDRLGPEPLYATEKAIQEGAEAVRSLLA